MQFTTTVKDYFRANTIVHFSLIVGLVFFMLVSFFLNLSGEIQIPEVHEIFKIVAPSVVLLAFIVSKMIYRQKIASLQEIPSITDKLNKFRSLMIIRNAILEGAGFLSIIGYMLTGNLLYAGLGLLVIFYMLILFPSKQRVITDLQLNTKEEDFINNPDSVLDINS